MILYKVFKSVLAKILIIIFAGTVIIFAQDQPNPNVELPDFVITGNDIVNVQKAQKIRPEIVSAISESFLKPVYSPEELEVRTFSDPVKNEINLFDTLDFLKGNLKAGVGAYSLPVGELSYAFPFKSGIFEARAFGQNRRAYVDNSDKLNIGGAANLTFFINNESSFLPGTQFKLHGDYDVSSYKFYGSAADPAEKRRNNYGNISLSTSDLLNNVFLFGVDFSNDFSSLENENFSENLLDISGFSKLELANFSLIINADFKNQFVRNANLSSGQYNFIGLRPAVGLVFSEVLKAYFGFNYQKISGNDFFSPYASVALRFNKNLSLYGQFAPEAEFLTGGNFLRQNPYYNVQETINLFYKKQGYFKAALKYEYDKYYEVDGGFEYIKSNNMPYFRNGTVPDPRDASLPFVHSGRFDAAEAKTKSYSAFLNLMFHPGPFGIFYGNFEVNSTTDSAGNFLPYHPVFKGSLSYGYNFNFGVNAEATLEYNSSSYGNIENTEKVGSYVDVGLNIAYRVANNFDLTFEFSNLLNYKSYKWLGYKETPLDIIAGFNYKW